MEYEEDLFAERVRRKAQAHRLASGETQWTDQLNRDVRVKLGLAWDDATAQLGPADLQWLETFIEHKSLRSIGWTLRPDLMRLMTTTTDNERLLSLIEVEHESLRALSDRAQAFGGPYLGGSWGGPGLTFDPAEKFRLDVNRILLAHIVAFNLHHNSRLVPVDSHEMHGAVVEPTLYLLHSQPRFADAEVAYQNALKELRNHEAGDAITDAATALQEVLTALGCSGGALGDLLRSARNRGLVKGNDTPLTEAVGRTIDWVAAKRNQGEAHKGDPDINMSDAWMVVHVVGALVLRLSEASQGGST